ncbi:hypothetical protein D1007_12268 [Hordeum vulgare]|nr:hypothetical protein D1007_12268 [Hordeum vulgare]
MVFESIPSYDDVVVKVRGVIHWIDPSDEVKLIGRVEVYIPNFSGQPPHSQPKEAGINDRAIVTQEQEVHAFAYGDDGVISHVHDSAYAKDEEIHYHPIGNLDVSFFQQYMVRNLPNNRMYWYGSYDVGPKEELDEDGFMEQENPIVQMTYKKQ